MNLDELQSVQSRERQTDSLQQLRESFYEDAGEFIQQLRDEREHAAERADDPFDAPEVNRLSDDINTAEQTVEAIYERRVGKIVKMASLAAADMPAEEEGLTREERDLFETLVGAIENNRDHVLDVLAGEASPGAVSSGTSTAGDQSAGSAETPAQTDRDPATPGQKDGDSASPRQADQNSATPGQTEQDPATPPTEMDGSVSAPSDAPGTDEASTVDAADVMGSGGEGSSELPPEVPPEEPPGGQPVETDDPLANDPEQSPASDGGTVPSAPDTGPTTKPESSTGAETGSDASSAVDRTTVRITDDIGEIFGVDQREYDLSTDDVVTLPAENAKPLVERDAAESLE